MGEEFIPMINKGGGAGMQVTAYTQTMSDIEAKIGNKAKAGQVIGNFNNVFMLRVRETSTAELLTNQLPKVQVFTAWPNSKTLTSLATPGALRSVSLPALQDMPARVLRPPTCLTC
ncbi:hypothetical protein ALP12_200126 [Pseudomonas savastanoi pv. phaseolicola]|nr:hypothetical protein ALP12_200126 [Pseudomonas savastanoi pv. phaseolicola]